MGDCHIGEGKHTVEAGEDSITVDGKKITIYKEPDASKLPWGLMKCCLVFQVKIKKKIHKRQSRTGSYFANLRLLCEYLMFIMRTKLFLNLSFNFIAAASVAIKIIRNVF